MTRWAAFAGVTLVVLVSLLCLARASQSVVRGSSSSITREDRRPLDGPPDGADHLDTGSAAETRWETPTDTRPATPKETPAETPMETPGTTPKETPAEPPTETVPASGGDPSTTSLLANVAVTHGLFAALLVGGALATDVPAAAFGVTADPLGSGLAGVGVGMAVGIGLALANTLASGLVDVFDVDPSEELRELLAPETGLDWVLLLAVVLPLIAGFEELLFRGALVGAFAVGFGVSPWLLVVPSSVAFAVGHGAQGGLGVVVTGLLGVALAAVFVLTDSLLVVVVAHYVVNAVEFVVVEGLGWQPFGGP